jgi:hypothetical protein
LAKSCSALTDTGLRIANVDDPPSAGQRMALAVWQFDAPVTFGLGFHPESDF